MFIECELCFGAGDDIDIINENLGRFLSQILPRDLHNEKKGEGIP